MELNRSFANCLWFVESLEIVIKSVIATNIIIIYKYRLWVELFYIYIYIWMLQSYICHMSFIMFLFDMILFGKIPTISIFHNFTTQKIFGGVNLMKVNSENIREILTVVITSG